MKQVKEFVTGLSNLVGMAFWVEITTDQPECTYYFGPFLSEKEAYLAQGGYIEDLEAESAQGIGVQIKRCHPENLTVFDEEEHKTYNDAISKTLSTRT